MSKKHCKRINNSTLLSVYNNIENGPQPFFNKKSSEVQDPQKHNSNFPPQGNISPGTKLEEGKGNAASGDDSSLLRAMMM